MRIALLTLAGHNETEVALETPLYQHDCAACTFLGTYRAHDLYFCSKQPTGPTVLARYGHDGREYSSGIAFAAHDPIIGEALARARARGLVT